MSSPRVVHVIDHFGVGGAQRCIIDQLQVRSDQVVVVLRNKKAVLQKEVAAEKIISDGKWGLIGIPLVALRLYHFQRRNEYPILHAHLQASWIICLILSWLLGPRQKVLFHEHGWIAFGQPWYSRLALWCARRGQILAVSSYIQGQLESIGLDAGEVPVIRNGLNSSMFYPDKRIRERWRTSQQISSEAFLVGFAGRLQRHKGWREFVELFANPTEFPELHGVIVGDGPDLGKLRRMVSDNGLHGRITVMRPTEAMNDFYNALDVFVFPSHIEPLGRVHLEAQACGIPVIVTRIPGLIETVDEECAILVTPKSVGEMKAAVRTIHEDEQVRERLITRGLLNAQKHALELAMEKFDDQYSALEGDLNG